ncbi:MAG: acetate/propionate family kinase [Clostridia bacterium]|nr:acetate/propionate family kinase [Clostridia bacterium]
MKILICNAGSTSLKFKLWDMPGFGALAEGRVERVGGSDAIYSCRVGAHEEKRTGLDIPDYTAGVRLFLNSLTAPNTGAVASLAEIDAVGFKTVLSRGFGGVHFLTQEVLDGMEAMMSVAPAHNGPYLEAIRVFEKLMPDAPRIGVFETAFHASIPLERRVYPVPYEWFERYGVMRMGYHGASHGYIAEKLAGKRRVISCHLGGSGSLCAILDGKSVDNSFGLSLQAGIPHAQRAGDIDPYVIPYMLAQGLTMDEVLRGLGKNGGLKGLSGASGDLRDIEVAVEAGSERARLALDVYVTGIARYIGAYYVELGGLDALAFTGGIGENSWRVREMVLDRLGCIGVRYDRALNRACRGEAVLSAADSAVSVHVIPANEEWMVVRSAYNLLAQSGNAREGSV